MVTALNKVISPIGTVNLLTILKWHRAIYLAVPKSRSGAIRQPRCVTSHCFPNDEPAHASFSAAIPATINRIPAIRSAFTGSPSKTTAKTAVPTMPMPTHTA